MPENSEKKSSKKLLAILIPVVIVIAVLAVVFGVVIPKNKKAKYQDAVALMEAEEYEQARSAFLGMEKYEDAAELAEECEVLQEKLEDYNFAKADYEKGKWEQAQKAFDKLKDYKDSATLKKNCENHLSYESALADLKKGNYQDALAVFEKLGSFEEAPAKAEECRTAIAQMEKYDAAVELFEAENFSEAKVQFEELGDYRDSGEYVQMCALMLDYGEAEALFADKDYEAAKKSYEAILENHDSPDIALSKRGEVTPSDRIVTCDAEMKYAEAEKLFDSGDYKKAVKALEDIDLTRLNDAQHTTKARNMQKYADAMALYKDGHYYDAHFAFLSAEGIADADDMAQKCIQPTPGTGETYRNPNYAGSDCSLTIYPPTDDGNHNFIKLYTVSEELVSSIFIQSGGSGYVELPGGQYIIKVAYGSGDWYGDTDMFGDDGYYYVLNLGSGEIVELAGGYAWELTLRTSSTDGQSMGEESVPRNSF